MQRASAFVKDAAMCTDGTSELLFLLAGTDVSPVILGRERDKLCGLSPA
jgi:hypothetical protein